MEETFLEETLGTRVNSPLDKPCNRNLFTDLVVMVLYSSRTCGAVVLLADIVRVPFLIDSLGV